MTYLLLNIVKIYAQVYPISTNNCLGINTIQTSLNAKKDSYRIFVDYVGIESSKYSGTISYLGSDGICKKLEIINGVGQIEFNQDGLLFMELSVPDQSTVNNIQIKLISDSLNKYTCNSNTYCNITYQDKEMKLLPNKLTSVFDTVKLIQYSSFDNSEIQTVNYAVDGKIAYSSSKFKTFNMNYVSSGEHALQTQIVLENGSVILYEEQVENGTIMNLYTNFRSWIFNNSVIFINLSIFLTVCTLIIISIWVIRKIKTRILWSSTHDATSSWLKNTVKSGKILKDNSDHKFLIWYIIKKPLIIIAVVFTGYIFVSNYIIALVKTDGISMMDTLQDNQQLAVNRIGRTLASINKNNYIPNRGDVVIVNKAQDVSGDLGILDESLVVKRLIGLPGDKVVMSKGVLTVDYIENERTESLNETEKQWYKSVLKGETEIDFEITIGVGELFVVGDNRDNSIDSRFYGPIKADQLFGEVIAGL